jgi:hypothetical protein
MITSSGAICDVCGKYILPLASFLGLEESERVNEFRVKGIKEILHCDNKCKELMITIGNDWKKLPKDGRLYKAFEEHYKKNDSEN